MPDPQPIETHWPLGQAHCTLAQALAWIAWRDPDRVRRDPDQVWRGRTLETTGAWRLLKAMLERGTVRSSRRKAKDGPRQLIDRLEWCDVELMWFDNPRTIGQENPRLYNRNTPDRDFFHATAEPWWEPLFDVADLLAAFPPLAEAVASISQATANAPEPVAPKPVVEEPWTTKQREVKAALLRVYPGGKGTLGTYDKVLDRLAAEKLATGENLTVGRSTLVRVLAKMPTEWREKRWAGPEPA